MQYLACFILAIISSMVMSNVINVRLYGVDSLKKADNVKSALILGCSSGILMILVAAIAYPLVSLGFKAWGVSYLSPLVVLVLGVGLTAAFYGIARKWWPKGEEMLHPYWVLIAVNAAVLAVALENVNSTFGLAMANAIGSALGYIAVLVIFAAIKVKLDGANVPAPFKGLPILLIVAGVAAMVVMACSGMVSLGNWGIAA